MGMIFDLLGDPVPANWGERGRPQHIPTQENRNKVSVLIAFGWSNRRIAAALFVTLPTLRKHYFSELHHRAVARDRLEAGLATKLLKLVRDGNVSAIKEFRKLLERNDLMTYGQTAPLQPAEEKPAKLGKKDQALLDARQPDQGTPLGELMARRATVN